MESRRRRALARQKQYAERHRAVVLTRKRAHYRKNAERRRAEAREYYWRFTPEQRATLPSRRWRPPQAYKAEIQRRTRARKKAPDSPGVSLRDWKRLVARYGGCCAYCGRRAADLEQDHVIPLVRGGRHAIGNVLPACRSCNAKKGTRFLMEWRAA